MPPSGDVVNDAAIPFLLPSRLSGRSISLSRNAAGARAAGRNLFGKRQHVQTAQHFCLHEFADGNGNDAKTAFSTMGNLFELDRCKLTPADVVSILEKSYS